jgi:hypothetical protein
MRQKVHVLDRLTGKIRPAELRSNGRLAIILEDGQEVDSCQFEVLSFPHEDELGAARWSNSDAS